MRDIKCQGVWDVEKDTLEGKWRLAAHSKESAKEWYSTRIPIPLKNSEAGKAVLASSLAGAASAGNNGSTTTSAATTGAHVTSISSTATTEVNTSESASSTSLAKNEESISNAGVEPGSVSGNQASESLALDGSSTSQMSANHASGEMEAQSLQTTSASETQSTGGSATAGSASTPKVPEVATTTAPVATSSSTEIKNEVSSVSAPTTTSNESFSLLNSTFDQIPGGSTEEKNAKEAQALVNLFAPHKLRHITRMEKKRRDRLLKEARRKLQLGGESGIDVPALDEKQLQELCLVAGKDLHLSQSFIRIQSPQGQEHVEGAYRTLPVYSFWKGHFKVRLPEDSSDKTVEEKFLLQMDRNANPEAKHVKLDGIGHNAFGRFELTGQYEASTGILRLTKQYKILPPAESQESSSIIGATETDGAQDGGSDDGEGGRRKSGRRKRVSTSVYGEDYVNPSMRKKELDAAAANDERSTVPPAVGEKKRKIDMKKYSHTCRKQRTDEANRSTKPTGTSLKQFNITESVPASDMQPLNDQSSAAMQTFYNDVSEIKNKVVAGSEAREIQEQHNQAQFARKQARVSSRKPKEIKSTASDNTVWVEAHRLPPGSGRLTGDLFEGEMKRGKPHGYGTVVYLNGWMFEGQFKEGKESGWGVLTDENDVVLYEGELLDGELQGYGHMYYENGSNYCGCWRDGLFHGHGSFYQEGEGSYVGYWMEGYRHGHGIVYYADGSSYDGQWVYDKRKGHGEYFDKSGFKYKGEWEDSLPHGKGRAVYPDGGVYEGAFSNGRRDGRGTLQFPGGATYTGRWKEDKMEGTGTVDTPQGAAINDDVFFIPVNIQADMKRIHRKAGFSASGD
eukprot:gb/GECG01009430.1/.p1 GENE.gb/GECG01009430.1/~~gb/GECG01009430.1/.p1  ORF type:complete len:850 (+),score=152.54 gb/GECG01009430.1/:1-2550(+)